MRVDLHNHTPLCKHAVDEPRQYVLSAINSGCEYFGFSDHAPMKFDEAYRMDFSQMRSYESEILRLKDEFGLGGFLAQPVRAPRRAGRVRRIRRAGGRAAPGGDGNNRT